MFRNIFLILLVFMSFYSTGQEILTGLESNPVLLKSSNPFDYKANVPRYDTLPFIDDFSYNGYYPDIHKWSDDSVFINNDYCKNPPTIGVATFDALNNKGKIYKRADSYAFKADVLTSIPIRLDSVLGKGVKNRAITRKDSLYFSFYYQPQGIGDKPEPGDSLVLEFFSPKDTLWHFMWSSAGEKLDSFYKHKGDWFKKVIISVSDSAKYYSKGFRFRFSNYASLADDYLPSWGGNVDIWNIDYVYLDINRRLIESESPDVSFTSKINTLLKDYKSMPLKQFLSNPTEQMSDIIELPYRNYSSAILSVYQIFHITDLMTKKISFKTKPDTTVVGNMPAFSDLTYSPNLTAYNFDSDSLKKKKLKYADFEVFGRVWSKTIKDRSEENNSIKFVQRFYNYYAYDDGNPEAGIGLSTINGKFAYKFTLTTVPDTLKAVQVFFNSTLNNANHKFFYIQVYDDNNGKPGNLLYEQSKLRVSDVTHYNEFQTFVLKDSIILKNKTFYVGIKQTTIDNLNLGFDLNNNKQDKLFYNIDGNWYNSMYAGALMLRPVFNSTSAWLNIDKGEQQGNSFILYPNPLNSNLLFVKLQTTTKIKDLRMEIYSPEGKKLYSGLYRENVDLTGIKAGLYFVRLYNIDNSFNLTKKLVIY
ncbi:MAG: T9SS type A sorting domain-containing protein [Bacteroidales bacterium]|nr:T9SS type A sorting domain-containing protein [Bacteroidales bacterium]